jgi:predicted nucleic acid-binding protein
MSAELTFLDTNVLVYAYDSGEPEKAGIAKRLLSEVDPGEFVLSTQVLSEFYVTVTRKLKRALDGPSAAQAVDLLSLLNVVSVDVEVVKAAARISEASQISYWDGLIVAAAAAAGCGRVLSEDMNDGQVIAGVRVENPFV